MSRHHFPILGVFALLTILTQSGWSSAQEPVEPTRESPAPPNPIEVQTRGPLHEAFAQPFNPSPAPGTTVPKQPPPPVPEEPPTQKPEAENAQWIPGYWAWDAERQDYLWVSGTYRIAPAGRKFVPGYWSQSSEGWRWVPGFWASENQPDVPFTPQPPAPLDNGPSSQAPDENSIYIPGSWGYDDNRFLWRPGYWAAAQSGRIWNPAHYVWTPNGYLFVNGYWDYPLQSRGLAFAPVYFSNPLWQDPNWMYQPNYVVNPSSFLSSGFVFGPSFYFGNYYGANYARLGYNPWFNGAGRYDPLFAYHGWQHHRTNPNWIAGVQQTYIARANGQQVVPPRTLAQQNALAVRNANFTPVVSPLNQFAASSQLRLVHASSADLRAQRSFAQQTREIGANRSRIAAGNLPAANNVGGTRSLHMPTVMTTRTGPQMTFSSQPRLNGGANTSGIQIHNLHPNTTFSNPSHFSGSSGIQIHNLHPQTTFSNQTRIIGGSNTSGIQIHNLHPQTTFSSQPRMLGTSYYSGGSNYHPQGVRSSVPQTTYHAGSVIRSSVPQTMHHSTPAVHHSTPAVHHSAPAMHHAPSGGGGHGHVGGGGHRR